MQLKKGLQAFILNLTEYNDIVLAILVVAVISLMILPMPPYVVDMMLATNMGCTIVLLMLSLYIPSSLSLSTFPTLLLFTTLFRLALNITTTRQILLHAYAGQIIFTFGDMVVGGNYIVGGVVFLIITIVQFLVIAKGSERVAEVGARFTLDAMPGKQMSIDADMRAGAIDMQEARQRRREVEDESKLYGAMDGAMKFVKGDAIAGLVITVINIIGGISIGILQKGMTFQSALQKYTILTIGDGLVSQIPALFISITAGIIVTRVNSAKETGPHHLGGEIGTQILSQPKAMLISGVILIAFALVPGFPKIQFCILAAAIGGGGFFFHFVAPKLRAVGVKDNAMIQEDERTDFSLTVPLLIDIAESEREVIQATLSYERLSKIGNAFYQNFGIPSPKISIRFNRRLPQGTYYILVQEIPLYKGHLPTDKLLAKADEHQLETLEITYTTEAKFLPDLPTIWVNIEHTEKLIQADIPYLDTADIICHHISGVLIKHAVDFIGLPETRFLLDQMEAYYGGLVHETLQVVSLQQITEILQYLAGEEISIRNLKLILQSITERGQREKNTGQLAEYVRISLKRYICYKYSDPNNVIHAILLDSALEETIRGAIRKSSFGTRLVLEPEVSKAIQNKIQEEYGKQDTLRRKPVILTTPDIRRPIKNLIELEMPSLPVISYQELLSEINVQPIRQIGL